LNTNATTQDPEEVKIVERNLKTSMIPSVAKVQALEPEPVSLYSSSSRSASSVYDRASPAKHNLESTIAHAPPMPSSDDAALLSVLLGDDKPAEALMRREMLAYGLQEVGPIVAELDLEDEVSEWGADNNNAEDSEDIGEEDDDDGDNDGENDEDAFGRSLKPQITNSYRRQMEELEKRLNARMLENVGPLPIETETLSKASSKSNLAAKTQSRQEEGG
jgi:hypothetical protein